jgi:hypothetical protein
MNRGLLLISIAYSAVSLAQAPEPAAAPSETGLRNADGSVQKIVPLAAKEVIERLKTLRSEIVVEEENIRLLKVRLERIELEGMVAAAISRRLGEPKEGPKQPMARLPAPPPKPAEPPPDNNIVVKSITTSPFKEAIVVYRGRTYTVRPGDRLGDVEIRDISESGVITGAGGRPAAVGR